jgi:hypothetical protein
MSRIATTIHNQLADVFGLDVLADADFAAFDGARADADFLLGAGQALSAGAVAARIRAGRKLRRKIGRHETANRRRVAANDDALVGGVDTGAGNRDVYRPCGVTNHVLVRVHFEKTHFHRRRVDDQIGDNRGARSFIARPNSFPR